MWMKLPTTANTLPKAIIIPGPANFPSLPPPDPPGLGDFAGFHLLVHDAGLLVAELLDDGRLRKDDESGNHPTTT